MIGRLLRTDNQQIQAMLKLAKKGDAKVWKNQTNTRVWYKFSRAYWKKFVDLHVAKNLRKSVLEKGPRATTI